MKSNHSFNHSKRRRVAIYFKLLQYTEILAERNQKIKYKNEHNAVSAALNTKVSKMI